MTDGIEYEVLHYRGDVTGSPDCQPGRLLGVNELGWPWEVIDAEYEPERATITTELYDRPVRVVDVGPGRTTVHVQTASADAVRAATARLGAAAEHVHVREPRHVQRQRLRAAGRL